MKKILFLTLLQVFLLANEKIDYTNPIFKDKAFQKLLEDEIRGGAYEGGDGGPYALYDLNPNYLKVEEPILSYILKVNGYQFPSKKEFKKKLKEMFNLESKARFFAFSTGKSYSVYYGLNNHMAEENWMNTIVFQKGFIAPYHRLPEWIDINAVSQKFKKLNQSVKEPNSSNFECWTPWRENYIMVDIELNIKEFVALNKYLFNNSKEEEVLSLGKSMVNGLVKRRGVHGNRVHINNKVYKSLWEFCNLTGMEEQKIRKLNPWINGDATNIAPNAEIVIDDCAFDLKRKNFQCLHPLDKKELDEFRDKKYREAEAYILKHKEDNSQIFRFNIIESLIQAEGEFRKIEGTNCFQYKIFESIEAPVSEYESQTWIKIEKREGKFVIAEVETAG